MAKKCIKIYESIVHPELHTSIYVGERKVTLEFTGHILFPKKVNGRIVTGDEKLQAAMESDPRNKVQWKCVKTNWIEQPELPKPELKGSTMFTDLNKGEEDKGSDFNEGDDNGITSIHGITNVTSARMRLSEKSNVPLEEIPTTKAEVIQWADEHQFELVGYTL